MRKLLILACLFLSLPVLPALASDLPPFQLIYRQENVASDRFNTRSDLMITVINLSGGEARDVTVSIPVANPYLYVGSPVLIASIPEGQQAEIMHKASMPNDLIAIAEPEDRIVWRIEYTNEASERVAVDVQGVVGQ